MSWGWLILAFFGGTIFGVFLTGLLAAGRDETAYRVGFIEGSKNKNLSRDEQGN
jgi:hypothetical protein